MIVPGGRLISAFSSTPDGAHMAVGLDDGSVVFGQVSFGTEIIPENEVPPGLKPIDDHYFYIEKATRPPVVGP